MVSRQCTKTSITLKARQIVYDQAKNPDILYLWFAVARWSDQIWQQNQNMKLIYFAMKRKSTENWGIELHKK